MKLLLCDQIKQYKLILGQINMEGLELYDIGQITSNQIADITGKRHNDVMRDIRVMESRLASAELRSLWKSSSYIDKQGKSRINYTLSKRGSLLLASRYDVNINLELIKRWEILEMREALRNKEEKEYLRSQAMRLYWEARPEEYRAFINCRE
ncbi:Rha family transcriptional regulator [Ulvibacterium marinum]|uniref:Rha family transcriptional regulator n=1 Tax=Ulvibacterium marinum TaxID=2419782 RepID=A0A3B0CGC6_9FLAO|nr:Rha family transcriptional regulator [Ulvibacterium marinum]RKN83349.1 hypothetical protein D7Z94_05865 [Ulvibacterium marinum]